MIKRLAVIPARKNSKRIENKNIYNFYGKPIIWYALNAARKSNLFDTIHVSTNCEKTIKLSKKFGFPVFFKRPHKLASDNIALIDVVNYELEEFKKIDKNFDVVTLLYPCCPLINHTDLTKANKIFEKNKKAHPVISVSSYPAPPEWAFKKDGKFIYPVNKKNIKRRSQDFSKKYFDTGDFIFYQSKIVKKMLKKNYLPKFIPYEIDRLRSVDIDNIEDLNVSKRLFLIKN